MPNNDPKTPISNAELESLVRGAFSETMNLFRGEKKPTKWEQTPAAADYHREYNRAHYDEFKVRCPKGEIERIDEAAKLAGMSRSAFVRAAVMEKIEKHT